MTKEVKLLLDIKRIIYFIWELIDSRDSDSFPFINIEVGLLREDIV